MDKVHYSGDPERMFPCHRIFAVLEQDECLAEQAFELGRLKIGGFVVSPFEAPSSSDDQIIPPRRIRASTAICLSGGGVEGLLFEVGVMKALNAHLQSTSVTDFDIFCGISAGSMLAAFLANGTEPEDIAAAIVGEKGHDMDTFTPSDLFDPDFTEYRKRLWALTKAPLPSAGTRCSPT